MVLDALLRLSGTGQNAPVEGGANSNIAQTVTADTSTPEPVYFGANRSAVATQRIAGAVSGAGATLDTAIQAGLSAAGPWINVASFPQRNSSDLTRGTPAGTSQPDRIIFSTPPDRPWIRAFYDTGGTTPSFGGVSVVVEPQARAGLLG
jgi:hypothetical protein